ncbi:NAD(P)-binding protein [Pseudovirgaria hyperparasitica]|uniref:NAD(P)-binding protein n=1 Tax=Pseudovirgaria hyperparasitica TaxID=470096 RepID=A0A6A6VZ73_9PEZI|nr:NAD(P)-binding protein [Pseudovirgaria hyperparasitica]KAF2754111.1 NAD(P)-binding protein [Pseudovirgaria hyperparasitica]
MTYKVALTGTTGKLGGAVLRSICENKLIAPSQLVIATSSDPSHSRWDDLRVQGASIRSANFDDPSSMVAAFQGCDRVFIVSSTVISLDFHDCAEGGRERHHIAAIDAARAAGVKHIYYTSLGFADRSKSEVMRAHLVTEKYLQDKVNDTRWTILREGLYNESWPLYLGHWNIGNDQRAVVKIAGDGKINWTSIPDLGLANASIIVDDSLRWNHKIVTLSAMNSHTLAEVAEMVSSSLGRELRVEIVSRNEHEQYYIDEQGEDEGMIKWWSRTYDALPDGECEKFDNTFVQLLRPFGRGPKPMQETVAEMLK